jgi:hypothetical protein
LNEERLLVFAELYLMALIAHISVTWQFIRVIKVMALEKVLF